MFSLHFSRILPFLGLIMGLCAPLRAQNAPSLEVAPVKVENRRLFDVGAFGNASAAQRAARINRRLQNLVESEADLPTFSPDDVKSTSDGEVIELGGVGVLTVSAQDAEDAGQKARDLALLQGAQLSRAVTQARASRQNPLHGAGILISNSLRDLIASFFRWLPRVFAALLLFGVFFLGAKIARLIARKSAVRLDFDPNLRALVMALSFYGVWFFGVLAILSALGLDSSSLAAAVGVSGFVLGFAFKDILSHFLAGILLLVSGKIRIGDQIVVREWEGVVERIELRALELRTDDNRLVIIPNADVFSAPITSNTDSPHRRRSFAVPIASTADLEAAFVLVETALKQSAGVLETPAPEVLVEEITKEATLLRVHFSTSSTCADYRRVGSEAMKNVKAAFRDAGFAGHHPTVE